LVFATSQLKKYIALRSKSGGLGIMWQSGEACLPADCCLKEQAS
jgi:hypothetical protein